jgi:hypothetical protein
MPRAAALDNRPVKSLKIVKTDFGYVVFKKDNTAPGIAGMVILLLAGFMFMFVDMEAMIYPMGIAFKTAVCG